MGKFWNWKIVKKGQKILKKNVPLCFSKATTTGLIYRSSFCSSEVHRKSDISRLQKNLHSSAVNYHWSLEYLLLDKTFLDRIGSKMDKTGNEIVKIAFYDIFCFLPNRWVQKLALICSGWIQTFLWTQWKILKKKRCKTKEKMQLKKIYRVQKNLGLLSSLNSVNEAFTKARWEQKTEDESPVFLSKVWSLFWLA